MAARSKIKLLLTDIDFHNLEILVPQDEQLIVVEVDMGTSSIFYKLIPVGLLVNEQQLKLRSQKTQTYGALRTYCN